MRKNKVSNREVYEELKRRRATKRIIRPGPWSKIQPEFSVVAKLKKNKSIFNLPDFLGKYVTHDDGYAGDGFRAIVNIVVDDLVKLVEVHGIDMVLAACEKSLNSYKGSNGHKVLGDVVIAKLQDSRLDKEEKYMTCIIKTNRKRISKFMGLDKDKLVVF